MLEETATDLGLVLPHLLQSTEYREFWRNFDGYKILDNGEAESFNKEIKEQVRGEELIEAAEMIGADEVVIPDTMRSTEMTLRQARAWRDLADTYHHFKFGAVAQGTTAADIWKCIREFQAMDYVKVLYLPRILCAIDRRARAMIAEEVHELWPGRFEIHCLGSYGQYLTEPIALSRGPARSIDTSAPVVLGIALKNISDQNEQYKKRQENYFELRPGRQQRAFVHSNAVKYCAWADAETPPSGVRELSSEHTE